MWVLILITVTFGTNTSPNIVSVDGFKSREACISAVKFSKNRRHISDAYCLSK